MVLKQKELEAIKDLQTQEQSCIKKYQKYAKDAKDPVLKELFQTLEKKEQQHFDTLSQVINGNVPQCDVNDKDGKEYSPKATYGSLSESEDKNADCFLVTDCIGTEKMVSSEYNSNVFKFADSCLRKLLADIQVEEQNHAEMLYKYKTVNAMA